MLTHCHLALVSARTGVRPKHFPAQVKRNLLKQFHYISKHRKWFVFYIAVHRIDTCVVCATDPAHPAQLLSVQYSDISCAAPPRNETHLRNYFRYSVVKCEVYDVDVFYDIRYNEWILQTPILLITWSFIILPFSPIRGTFLLASWGLGEEICFYTKQISSPNVGWIHFSIVKTALAFLNCVNKMCTMLVKGPVQTLHLWNCPGSVPRNSVRTFFFT